MSVPPRSSCRPLIAALLLAVCVACSGSQAPEQGPGVILVTIDALRADALSGSGPTRARSPNLDRFAADGVAFSEAISSFFGTSAAMPSLMTGLYPNFEGVDEWTFATQYGFSDLNDPDEQKGLTRNVNTLAEILRSAGYATAGFNTNPYLGREFNFHQGFAHYESFSDYLEAAKKSRKHKLEASYPPADVVVDRVLQWLDTRREHPYFVWFHLMDPHSPYLPPPPFDRLPGRRYIATSDLEINEALYRRLLSQNGAIAPREFASFSKFPGSRQEAFVHLRALYDGEVGFADRELGRLFGGLRKRGLWERALVVITADHGEEFLDHGHVIHHGLEPGMEELIRIPLMIRLPNREKTRRPMRIDRVVAMVDIAPTVLDYAGLADRASGMDGTSLRPLIEGSETSERTAFISAIEFGMARTKQWKYRRVKKPFGEHVPGESLFRIADDPLEESDVAQRHPQVLLKLRGRYDAFAQRLHRRARSRRTSSETSAEIEPETAERLRGLGYLGE